MSPSIAARSFGLTWTRSGETLVILDLESSQYFSLNATASLLWPAIVAGTTHQALINMVVEHYDIDRGAAEIDVAELVDSLEKRSIVTTQSGA